MGSCGLIAIESTIIAWSKVPKSSNPYIGLTKSTVSSSIVQSLPQFMRGSADESKVSGFRNAGEAIDVSCFI